MAVTNPLRAVRDYLRGEDLKVRPPVVSQPARPPTLAQAAAEQKLWLWDHPGSLFTSTMYGPNGPLVHGPLAWKLYGESYGQVPIASNSAVFACLAVIAKGFMEAPLRVFRRQQDGQDEWLQDHPFQAVVDDPHPGLTPPELTWWRLVQVHVHGNAYLRKIRSGSGQPVEYWPLSPIKMRPVTTDADRKQGVFISHYAHEYEPSKYEDIPVRDIVHFRLGVDDRDHRLGCSPLQYAIREVASDVEASEYTAALLRNMGAVGLVVTLPQGVPVTPEQAELLRERIDATFTKDGRGRTSIMTNGATMAQMGFDPQKMNMDGAHRLSEERVAAVLGVHPMVAGLGAGLSRSTFSNYEEARDALFEQTIIPLYTADAATWQKQVLRPDFDTNPDVRCRYDLTDVRALQEDQNEIFERLSVAVGKKPFMTRNEARSEVGLLPVEGWDEQDTQPPPVPVLPDGGNGDDGGGGGDEEERPALPPPAAEERMRRLLAGQRGSSGQKAIGLGAFPGLMDAVQALAEPALVADLEAYLHGQGERVQRRLAGRA